MRRSDQLALVTVGTLALAGCGDNLQAPLAGLTRVSGDSPFEVGCTGAGEAGKDFRGVEVEPWLAIDPTDPHHLIGVWQQDRWSSGGASGLATGASFDGGAHWTRSYPAFSRCEGGELERSTDPWVTFGPDGVATQIAVAFDAASPRNAVLASQSTDGGVTWSPPATLLADNDPDVFNDKESITADPTLPGRVYATWDRLTGLLQPKLPIGTGPTWLARMTAGAWEPARIIFDPGLDAQTIGNVIVVLPDGTLVDVFELITANSTTMPISMLAVIRSTDHGDTWSAPIVITRIDAVGVHDPGAQHFVRTGAGLPSIAADPTTGALAIVWEDSRFGAEDGIAIVRSSDGGMTWSAPSQVNGEPATPAFAPAVAITAEGTIAVTYDDLRDDRASATSFRATAWLATSQDGGATWSEEPLTGAFDLRPALVGGSYFLGDYQGLAVSAGELVPLFVAATPTGTDVFVRATGR